MSPSSQTRKHDYVAYQSNPEVNKSLPGFYSATNTYHLGQEKKKKTKDFLQNLGPLSSLP